MRIELQRDPSSPSALYTFALGDDGETLFAAVADGTEARYVYRTGDEPMFDPQRPKEVVRLLELQPLTPEDWLEAATTNMGYLPFSPMMTASSLTEAESIVLQRLDADAAASRRHAQLAVVAAAFDEVAQLYPGWGEWDGEDEDDDEDDDDWREADLTFKQLIAPSVHPAEPHEWLPLSVGDKVCGFCDQLPSASIHQPCRPEVTG